MLYAKNHSAPTPKRKNRNPLSKKKNPSETIAIKNKRMPNRRKLQYVTYTKYREMYLFQSSISSAKEGLVISQYLDLYGMIIALNEVATKPSIKTINSMSSPTIRRISIGRFL